MTRTGIINGTGTILTIIIGIMRGEGASATRTTMGITDFTVIPDTIVIGILGITRAITVFMTTIVFTATMDIIHTIIMGCTTTGIIGTTTDGEDRVGIRIITAVI